MGSELFTAHELGRDDQFAQLHFLELPCRTAHADQPAQSEHDRDRRRPTHGESGGLARRSKHGLACNHRCHPLPAATTARREVVCGPSVSSVARGTQGSEHALAIVSPPPSSRSAPNARHQRGPARARRGANVHATKAPSMGTPSSANIQGCAQ